MLEEIVSNKMKQMVADGIIESLISKRLESTIEECINDSMKLYGAFGRTIKDKIEESINISVDEISLPKYNKFITEIVNKSFIEILEKNALSNLTDIIEKSIPTVNKTEKTSTLLHIIQEIWGNEARQYGKNEIEITSEFNSDDNAMYVNICHPEYDFESIKATFYNFDKNNENNWHIGYLSIDGTTITGASIKSSNTHLGGIIGVLYKYYLMETKFEIDEELETIFLD